MTKRKKFVASDKMLTSSAMASMRNTAFHAIKYVEKGMKEETEIADINAALAKRERKNAKRLKNGL